VRALEHVLTASHEVLVVESLETWWRRHAALAATFEPPVELALVGGFAADRLGYAFASGYAAASRALFPGSARPAALAATEVGGVHPRAIATRLSERDDGWQLDGEKTFVTLGSFRRGDAWQRPEW
jgi:alkylation response protein AidB-like acyl-CoA dehydrogenase